MSKVMYRCIVVVSMSAVVLIALSAVDARAGVVAFCTANPGTCAAIAKAIADKVAKSGEGICIKLSTECTGKLHGGAKRVCHTVRNKVRNFANNPSDGRAEDLIKNTGSDRTACMASSLMGCENWLSFLEAYGYETSFRYACWE